MATRVGSARVPYATAKGFSRLQMQTSEKILGQRDANGVLAVIGALSVAELDSVTIATALNRIAKLAQHRELLLGADFAALC